MKIKDIKDKQLGGIIARKRYPRYKNNRTYWECECTICGRMKIMPLSCINKKPLSCGCIVKDLTGESYGELEVLRMLPKEGKVECFCHKCNTISKCDISYVKKMNMCAACSRKECGEKIAETLDHAGYRKCGTYLPAWDREVLNKNNTSGKRGLSYDKARGKWKVYIRFQKKTKFLGRYDSFEDAAKARDRAEEEIKQKIEFPDK